MDHLPDFPLPDGWSVTTLNLHQANCMFQDAELHENGDFSLLRNVTPARVMKTGCLSDTKPKMKGWQQPGPGPKPGRSRIPSVEDLKSPFLLALIHLMREAIHFQQLYSFHSNASETESLNFSKAMTSLDQMESDLPVSRAMRRCIWTTTQQLGVPSFLVKLKSPFHAVSLHFLPDRTGHQWSCSLCITEEINLTQNCVHAYLVQQCIEQISNSLSSSVDYVLCSMTQSSAFNLISNLTSTCFYGVAKKMEFVIFRDERTLFNAPVTSSSRLHIVRRTSNTKRWSCLTRACAGTSHGCIHCRTVQEHIERGLMQCIPSIFDLVREQDRYQTGLSMDMDMEPSNIPIPRHSRPLIPSETAFEVDFNVNRNSYNVSSVLLRAADICHCGSTIYDESSSAIANCDLRVETSRCYVNYRQEVWTCRRGHCVTPEESEETREGLVWISRDTAFTEVFLFDLLLHMTLGGGTIAGQSDIRSQLLFLQTHYMSRQHTPRSSQCIRKALIMYTMSVVKAIPAWVFRCQNCAVQSNGLIYYNKLSFDGQQIGFNIRKDVRYDFYGKPATPWRRPVDRCPQATSTATIIQSRHLKGILLESLRVREVPHGCGSVQALCRSMMNLSFRSKESVRAAVAAIKLFDPMWTMHLPTGTPTINDSSFINFSSTSNTELFAHPFQFISEIRCPSDFHRCKQVMIMFREVLDCRRAAAVISVLLNCLRNDLKTHIPFHDRGFIANYATSANELLHIWLTALSQLNSWTLTVPLQNINETQEEVPPGIGEHAAFLEHPFRPPFAWRRIEGENPLQYKGKYICGLRKVEEWISSDNGQTAVLLLVMALLTESVTVWSRDGELTALRAGVEVLRNAELYCGQENMSYHCRGALQQVHSIGLLYEGIMGLLGANTEYAKPMLISMRHVLEMVEDRFNAYLSCMTAFSSTKSFMCSPKEFDDMLMWTGAFGAEPQKTGQSTEDENSYRRIKHAQNMRDLYQKMASSKSNDFLETGIWGPDFPICRPSPSSAIWSNVPLIDVSCSKDFDVHNSFSPGTFGGYCLCRHAKTVILSFLKRPEGCRMPLNIIVERCARLPKYVVYDFACGTQKSALGLSAEISRHVSFVIDPFHFPGHKTCSLAMHESNFLELRDANCESQEQRNSSIKVMEKTLRASRDVHFMHFTIIAHAYLNLKAMFLDHRDELGNHVNGEHDWGSRAWLKWIRDNLFTKNW